MPIAFYGETPDAERWTRLWAREDLERLLAVTERDPLSAHLLSALPASGVVLEGGCGLGQYLLYLRGRGYTVVGGDFSESALRIHRRAHPDSPLAAMDLRSLPFASGVFAAHISLGVVEHLEEGPDAILREMTRTLQPGGVALVSVPWLNGSRRLLRPLISRRERQKRDAGMRFYQYAYSRREIVGFLARAGLRVTEFHPYNPGRVLRWLPRTFLVRPVLATRSTNALRSRARSLLSRAPVLNMTAHMILAVAVKES
jgi:SAM-dependent methyltransferase